MIASSVVVYLRRDRERKREGERERERGGEGEGEREREGDREKMARRTRATGNFRLSPLRNGTREFVRMCKSFSGLSRVFLLAQICESETDYSRLVRSSR